MRFRVLGPLEAVGAEGPIPLGGPKQRTVLAHLLMAANHVVSTDQLFDVLWGDDPPVTARNTLQTYVSNLRRALGDDRLIHRPPGYLLAVGADELDAERFEALLRDARKAAAADPRGSLPLLDDALALWRGPALADVADHDTLVAEATRLEELHLAAREERVDALLAAGDAARAASELERLLSEHPLRERLWSGLMLALYRDGRQSDALAAFQRARELLADELGIDPSPELVRRHEQILRQDPALELRGEPLRGYRLLERIGDGRIGTVFRALQPHVGRDVAVKVIHERIACDPDFVRRFDHEAQAVASLEHPHIAPIYDYWREPQAAYVVTRYVAGGSLAAAIERGIDDRDAATRIVRQVADALAFAHGRGIAHGEVTPVSVLLDQEGNAYLTDFPIGTRDADPEADARGLDDLAALLGRRDGETWRAADGAGTATTPDGHMRSERVRNPYKGLRPFTEADAGDFFGRRALVARLATRLNEDVPGARFLAVIGPSGSGKSSVVRAGLVPAIRHGAVPALEGCVVTTMHPGTHPLDELEAALLSVASEPPAHLGPTLQSGPRGLLDVAASLAPVDAEILLVIDQFEEVFTLTRDARERELFLDAIRVAAVDPQSRVRVVITLRADLFDRPLAQARFAELLGARNETVPPLTPGEVEQAIRLPAERVDVHPEPGLVAAIVSDVARQPGALPLLQYALTELFERRTEGRLTLESYVASGGVAGILSATADRVLERSGEGRRELVKQIFLRLVTLGEGRLDARRRITRAELTALQVDPAPVDEVLDAFGRSRLLTFDREPATREPTVEIAHEALLSAWSRLRGWIDDAREDLRRERRLARAAAEWRAAGRDPSFLLTGVRLAQLEAWAETTTVGLGVPEREYLVASVQQRAVIREEEERRAANEREIERRSQRRLRGLVAVLAVGALVASALSVVANEQRQEASRASRLAVARELAASSVANLDVDAERSILLALEAIAVTREQDRTVLPEAEEALHRALGASRVVRAFPSEGDMLDWSPDGSMFVTEGLDESGLITVRDAETGEPVTPTFTAHDPDVNGVAFSGDSSMLATTGDDGDVRVWDPRTGDAIWGFDGPKGKVWVPSFSPDGSLLAAPFDSEVVRVWDIERNELVLEQRHPFVGFVTSFSPDGRQLAFATWSDDPGAIVVDLATGRRVMRLVHGQDVRAVSWSPDGRLIATSGDDGTVRIWDAHTGEPGGRLFGHRSWIVHAEWAPDSSRIVTGSTDGTAKIWEVGPGGGQELLTITAQGSGGWVWPVFSPDGTQVMVGSRAAGVLRVWDVGRSGDAEWANLPVHEFFPGVAFTSDGEAVITGNNDRSVTLWDAETGEGLRALGRPGGEPGLGPIRSPIGWIDVSAGGLVAVADWSDEVTVWDEATGDERFVLEPPQRGGIRNFAWSPDGTLLAVVDTSGATRIVDQAGEQVGVVEEEPGFYAHAARFSPDNELLVTAREPTRRPNPETVRATIWDWRSGEVVRTLPTWPLDVAFDPTGSTIVAGTMPGGAELFDVDTGTRLATLSGHSGETWNVRFSPGGSLIATAGTDGTIRLWDAASGTLRLTLRGHRSLVSGLAFSPDGRMLASASVDGTARVWALDLDDLIELARHELTRGLSDEECRQYLHHPCEPTRADP